MPLTPEQFNALNRSEPLIQARNYQRYLRLKELLPQQDEPSRAEFQRTFKSYYGLNLASLGDEFLEAFFQALFAWHAEMDMAALLRDLHAIPTSCGQNTLQLSFVSKLVAIHDESRPIYDKHVKNFFGAYEPGVNEELATRIQWWRDFLSHVAQAYNEWANDEDVAPILARLRQRIPELQNCHAVRLLDFLVWKAGNQQLL